MDDLSDSSLEAKLNAPETKSRKNDDDHLGAAAKMIDNADNQQLADYFKQFSGTNIKVSLYRLQPELYKGRQVGGFICSYEELITEDQISEKFGGGKFQIKVSKILPSGKYQYVSARTFKLQGDPKLPIDMFAPDPPPAEPLGPPIIMEQGPPADVVKTAMSMLERSTLKADERAERAYQEAKENAQQATRGIDPNMLGFITEPMKLQIETLRAQLAEKESIIREKDGIIRQLSEKKPDKNFQDDLLMKMYEGESAKITQLRTQFDSERNMLINSHHDDIKRLEHRWEVDKSHMASAHQREIDFMKQSSQERVESLKVSYDGRMEARATRIKDLETEIQKLIGELNELRAKKEKSFVDQAKEMVEMRQTMEMLGIGGSQEEEPSTIEKVFTAASQNPIIQGLGARLAASAPPPPQQAEQPAPQQPRRLPPQQAQPQGQPRPKGRPEPQPAPQPQTQEVELPEMDAESIQAAVNFMESAIANGRPPEEFAASVRSMVPGAIIETIRKHGIDVFLDNVAQIGAESPLNTQIGRKFAREVAKILTKPNG